MNRLTNEERCRVLACLVEGNSIRSTVRITGKGFDEGVVCKQCGNPIVERAEG